MVAFDRHHLTASSVEKLRKLFEWVLRKADFGTLKRLEVDAADDGYTFHLRVELRDPLPPTSEEFDTQDTDPIGFDMVDIPEEDR